MKILENESMKSNPWKISRIPFFKDSFSKVGLIFVLKDSYFKDST